MYQNAIVFLLFYDAVQSHELSNCSSHQNSTISMYIVFVCDCPKCARFWIFSCFVLSEKNKENILKTGFYANLPAICCFLVCYLWTMYRKGGTKKVFKKVCINYSFVFTYWQLNLWIKRNEITNIEVKFFTFIAEIQCNQDLNEIIEFIEADEFHYQCVYGDR